MKTLAVMTQKGGAGKSTLALHLADADPGTVPGAVGQRASLAHALIDGRAVTEFEPEGKAADEIRTVFAWLRKHAL